MLRHSERRALNRVATRQASLREESLLGFDCLAPGARQCLVGSLTAIARRILPPPQQVTIELAPQSGIDLAITKPMVSVVSLRVRHGKPRLWQAIESPLLPRFPKHGCTLMRSYAYAVAILALTSFSNANSAEKDFASLLAELSFGDNQSMASAEPQVLSDGNPVPVPTIQRAPAQHTHTHRAPSAHTHRAPVAQTQRAPATRTKRTTTVPSHRAPATTVQRAPLNDPATPATAPAPQQKSILYAGQESAADPFNMPSVDQPSSPYPPSVVVDAPGQPSHTYPAAAPLSDPISTPHSADHVNLDAAFAMQNGDGVNAIAARHISKRRHAKLVFGATYSTRPIPVLPNSTMLEYFNSNKCHTNVWNGYHQKCIPSLRHLALPFHLLKPGACGQIFSSCGCARSNNCGCGNHYSNAHPGTTCGGCGRPAGTCGCEYQAPPMCGCGRPAGTCGCEYQTPTCGCGRPAGTCGCGQPAGYAPAGCNTCR